ncbi:MAG TPA: 2TM domain-containing protein [Burkholderiaceae bacterium]|nr:2TM domain-containing protein [Burkholderiaceae bacterium]
MNDDSRGDDIEARARRRVGMKMGFYTHALVYVLVNLGLFAIDAVRGDGRWAVWSLAGWGLGLAIHGIVTFANLRGEGIRQRMLEAEIERLRRDG